MAILITREQIKQALKMLSKRREMGCMGFDICEAYTGDEGGTEHDIVETERATDLLYDELTSLKSYEEAIPIEVPEDLKWRPIATEKNSTKYPDDNYKGWNTMELSAGFPKKFKGWESRGGIACRIVSFNNDICYEVGFHMGYNKLILEKESVRMGKRLSTTPFDDYKDLIKIFPDLKVYENMLYLWQENGKMANRIHQLELLLGAHTL